MDTALLWLVGFVESSKYVLLFLGTFTEGPLVMMGGGFLLRLGQVDFWPAYLALVAGDFAADLVWYWVGYFGARTFVVRFGYWFDMPPEKIIKMERLFHKYDTRILAISKLTMGLGLALATLTVAGMLRVSFIRYVVINLLCGLAWTLFLMILGYFFGNLYALIPGSFKFIFTVVAIGAVFLGLRVFSRYVSKMVD